MDRLSALDLSFLHLEGEHNHLHVGWIAVLEGPAPSGPRVEALVRSRLGGAVRYRQRLQHVPLGISRPVWVDAPAVDLAFHVRHTAVPAPGDMDQLEALISRVMARPLDRSRPLWELWVVDGIDQEHSAILAKVHPALLGGEDGADLLSSLLDEFELDPDGEGAVAEVNPGAWVPRPSPSTLSLVREAVEDGLTPALPIALARTAIRAPGALLGTAIATARGLSSLGGLAVPKSSRTLTGPLGSGRRWAWVAFPLDDARRIKDVLGGTVNDVVLAAVTAGFRDLLAARGVDPADRRVRTMLPVTIQRLGATTDGDDGFGTTGAEVSAMFAELPVGVADPRAALASISDQTRRLKASGQTVAASAMAHLADLAPPMLLALGVRAAAKVVTAVDELSVDTIVTNVPGPQEARFLLGQTVLHTIPWAPLVEPVRIAVAVHSYDGELTFGITADQDGVPDLEDFVSGIEGGLLELQHLAATTTTDA